MMLVLLQVESLITFYMDRRTHLLLHLVPAVVEIFLSATLYQPSMVMGEVWLETSTNGNNLTATRGDGAGNVSTASGADATDNFQSGNGGEGRTTNGTAADGGNGGRGAGGGGGGSVINATGTGGSGGNGGTGFVLVRSW